MKRKAPAPTPLTKTRRVSREDLRRIEKTLPRPSTTKHRDSRALTVHERLLAEAHARGLTTCATMTLCGRPKWYAADWQRSRVVRDRMRYLEDLAALLGLEIVVRKARVPNGTVEQVARGVEQ